MLTEKQRSQAALRQSRFRKRQQEARRREQREKGLPPMPKITAMPGSARWKATIEAAEALLQRKKRLTKMAETLSEMAMLW